MTWTIVCDVEGKNPHRQYLEREPVAPKKPKSRSKDAKARYEEALKRYEENHAEWEAQQKNVGGVIVKLEGQNVGGFSHGRVAHEVSRVAFVRRNGANPDVDFRTQVDAEIEKAKLAVELLNQYMANAGVLQ